MNSGRSSALTPVNTAQTQRLAQPYSSSNTSSTVNQDLESKNPLDIDWVTIGLGFLALIAVGGLIPFSLWVYYVLNPPIP